MENYESKIRDLSNANSELTEKINVIKGSHSKLSQGATSNLELSEKLDTIFSRSPEQFCIGSREQMKKQTDIMKELLTLKISSENLAMNHEREISSYKKDLAICRNSNK
jgi:hypothetical protein